MTPIRASITGPPLSQDQRLHGGLPVRQGKFRLGQLSDVLGEIPEDDERLPAKCRLQLPRPSSVPAENQRQPKAPKSHTRMVGAAWVAFRVRSKRFPIDLSSLTREKLSSGTITLRNPSLSLDPGALAPLARRSLHQSWGRLNAARTRRKYSVSERVRAAHRMPLLRLRQRFSSRSELVFDKLPKLSHAVCAISWRN